MDDNKLTGSKPKFVPDSLKFVNKIAGGIHSLIEWENDQLILTRPASYLGLKKFYSNPTKKEWEDFWILADKIDIWNWKKEFGTPQSKGERWELTLVHGNKSIVSSGNKAYPPNGDANPTDDYKKLTNFLFSLARGVKIKD